MGAPARSYRPRELRSVLEATAPSPLPPLLRGVAPDHRGAVRAPHDLRRGPGIDRRASRLRRRLAARARSRSPRPACAEHQRREPTHREWSVLDARTRRAALRAILPVAVDASSLELDAHAPGRDRRDARVANRRRLRAAELAIAPRHWPIALARVGPGLARGRGLPRSRQAAGLVSVGAGRCVAPRAGDRFRKCASLRRAGAPRHDILRCVLRPRSLHAGQRGVRGSMGGRAAYWPSGPGRVAVLHGGRAALFELVAGERQAGRDGDPNGVPTEPSAPTPQYATGQASGHCR